METRFATAADLVEFYGWHPPHTLRALVAVLDGKVVGVIGLSREDGVNKFFSDSKPELEPHLRSMPVLRAIKRVMRWAEDSRLPVVAVSDNGPLLERLGFENVGEDHYQCLSW